jgi:hypothetical protein
MPPDFPTLQEYREPVLKAIGGVLRGTVDVDPEITDANAPRTLISARLYDSEKISDAFGGQYVWVPRYGDSRRVEDRGYRIRFNSSYHPPSEGTYYLDVYGYGRTRALPVGIPASAVQKAIRDLSPDLVGVSVTRQADGSFGIVSDFRTPIVPTAGTVGAVDGVGVCFVNRSFTRPLASGTEWYLSPKLPFEGEDETDGIHDCINMALADIRVPDLYPVTATSSKSLRDPTIMIGQLAPWLTSDMVIGFFAPTDWRMTAVYRPPASGNYTLSLWTYLEYGPTATPLAATATGAQIEAALRATAGLANARVSPQGAASQYTIEWASQYYDMDLTASAGVVVSVENVRMRDPYMASILPAMLDDYETPGLSDPGYPEGSTWFIHVRRPANTRICPQTYPMRSDGSLDRMAAPIKGSTWIESTTGLVNDLDQGFPSVEQVEVLATRYAFNAMALAAPAGESGVWDARGTRAASQAAGKLVYGKQWQRGTADPRLGGAAIIGHSPSKGVPYFWP